MMGPVDHPSKILVAGRTGHHHAIPSNLAYVRPTPSTHYPGVLLLGQNNLQRTATNSSPLINNNGPPPLTLAGCLECTGGDDKSISI